MRDLHADWKRWSPTERVFAVTLATLLAVVSPVMLAIGTTLS